MSSSAGGSRGSRGLSRVSIPVITRETIKNIKEIAGNHSDDEVYAVLRECSMDPNETAHKLLFQDTFHEVKRKREKRKENVSIKEPIVSSRRFGIQGRGSRSGKGKHSSHYLSHDASFAKNPSADREIITNQCPEKAKTSIPQCIEKKSSLASVSISGIANGSSEYTNVDSFHGGSSQNLTTENNNFQSSSLAENISINSDQMADNYDSCVSTMDQSSSSLVEESEVSSPVSDLVVEPSINLCTTGVMGIQKTDFKPTSNNAISCGISSNVISASSCDGRTLDAVSLKTHSYIPDNSSDIFQAYESNNYPDESHVRPTSSSTSGSRPPSNYSNRSQQLIESKKVKVWKPKHTNANNVHTSEKVVTSNVQTVITSTALSNHSSEVITSKMQKSLEELHFSDDCHVFFPSHIQVPVSERAHLSFGSFTTSIVVNSNNKLDDKNCSQPSSESSQKFEENVEESSLSIENYNPTTEDDDVHPQSPGHSPENLSSDDAEISYPTTGQGRDQPQQGSIIASVEPQHSVIQTTPIYSTIGLIPSTVGIPFTTFESSDSQTHEIPRPSGIVVQQPFDSSANYYTQVYHTGTEGDGRYAPFCPTGATIKYTTALSSNTDLSQQEGLSSVIQPVPGPPIAAQTVTQSTLPVFRQPAGVHISHYPSNYIPYSPYFSPFYLPPHSVHPYLSNTAFPQQHPTASIYSPMAAAASIKYPVSQFKTGANNTHASGLPTGYGPYNSNVTGYIPNSAPNTLNSAGNEDLAASQYKENMYLSGQQQSEGSTVWIPTPGRDIIGLQANPFYNLPQGQHVAFTPTQAGHAAFPGIFHPTQMASTAIHPLLHQSQSVAGAVDMVNHQTGVYPPSQRSPINWANNY